MRIFHRRRFNLCHIICPLSLSVIWKISIFSMLVRERKISQKTLQFVFYEGRGRRCSSYILSSVWICSIDFTLGPDVSQREIALQQWAGELKCEHKRSPFCDGRLKFSTFSPYDKVHIWSQYVWVSLSRVQSVYRVCIVHEIVGVGGLFEWGGLARELRTLMEGLVLALATHVGGLWKLDMRGATVCKIHILLHCSAVLHLKV